MCLVAYWMCKIGEHVSNGALPCQPFILLKHLCAHIKRFLYQVYQNAQLILHEHIY